MTLGYIWKKNHIYTVIEYDDGVDRQKIILDFDKNIEKMQPLIYQKMLQARIGK